MVEKFNSEKETFEDYIARLKKDLPPKPSVPKNFVEVRVNFISDVDGTTLLDSKAILGQKGEPLTDENIKDLTYHGFGDVQFPKEFPPTNTLIRISVPEEIINKVKGKSAIYGTEPEINDFIQKGKSKVKKAGIITAAGILGTTLFIMSHLRNKKH